MDIFLEKFSFSEVDEVHALWSDEGATLYTNFPYLATLEECRQRLVKMQNWYSQRNDHFGPFAIRAKDRRFLGLTGGDAGSIEGQYEIWYFIRRDMWGKKIATAAVTLLLESMKQSNRAGVIKAEAVVNNQASWLFLEKLGFQRTNVVPSGHTKNGKTWDRYVYTLTVSSHSPLVVHPPYQEKQMNKELDEILETYLDADAGLDFDEALSMIVGFFGRNEEYGKRFLFQLESTLKDSNFSWQKKLAEFISYDADDELEARKFVSEHILGEILSRMNGTK